MKLSIIVPAYNVEQYLNRCIDSCQRQNISKSEYEVIIVNDGSTDNTLNFANELAVKYENVKVITQENRGLSGARNTGMDNAAGDYLWFVDGDDYIKENVLGQLLDDVFKDDLDICIFDAEVQCSDGNTYICKQPSLQNLGIITGEEAILTARGVVTVWLILYKKIFLLKNKLRFAVGLIHEDVEFDMRVYYFVERMKYIPLCCYEYCYNQGSLSRPKEISKIKRNLYHDLLVMSNIRVFIEQQKNMSDELTLFYKKRINSVTYSVIATSLFNPQIDTSFLHKCISFSKTTGLYPFKGGTESWKTTLLSKAFCFDKLLIILKKILFSNNDG